MVGNDLNIRTSPHLYTVDFVLSGDNLIASEISKRLNLQANDLFRNSSVRSGSVWVYNGYAVPGFESEWESLEVGLRFLVNSLIFKKAELKLLGTHYEGVWWCGHFQSSFNGGPTLSADLLTELATFGFPLSIDNYHCID